MCTHWYWSAPQHAPCRGIWKSSLFFFQVIIGNPEISTLQCVLHSDIARGGLPPLTVKNLPKRGENWGKTRKNMEEKAKIGKVLDFAPPGR